MEWITNETLFYGGIAVFAGASAALLIFSGCLWALKLRLGVKLDEEYGKEQKKRRGDRHGRDHRVKV